MKILLIEDDLSIRNVLRLGLEADAFAVDEAEDGEKGSYLARVNQYDLIILDNILPKKLGKQVCQEIREGNVQSPILLLSAKNSILDKVELLNSGADDYLTKPFSFEELKARIKTLLRRPVQIQDTILRCRDLKLNRDTHEVARKDKKILLTRKEFSMLEFMMMHQNKLLTRASIMEHVWDMNSDPFSNTVEAHILNLRKKIGDKNKILIQNVPGRGYRLVDK
jgi:two-component system, OmpR family, copper resistance phosphate regulon response regulator CusR